MFRYENKTSKALTQNTGIQNGGSHTHRRASWQTGRKSPDSQGKHLGLQQLWAYLFSPLGTAFKGRLCGMYIEDQSPFFKVGEEKHRKDPLFQIYICSELWIFSILCWRKMSWRQKRTRWQNRACTCRCQRMTPDSALPVCELKPLGFRTIGDPITQEGFCWRYCRHQLKTAFF